MTKMDDLMEGFVLEDEALEKQIREEPIEFTEDEKERVLARLKSNMGIKKKKTWKAAGYSGLAAACIILFFITGFVVVASIQLDDGILGFLSPKSKKMEDTLNHMGNIIDQQVVVDGYAVHVKESINDGNTAYILLDIISPENQPLTYPSYSFHAQYVEIEDNKGLGFYFTQLEDDNPEDNKISLILSLDAQGNIAGKRMTLNLFDLCTEADYLTENEKKAVEIRDNMYAVIHNGAWKFEFELGADTEGRKIKQNTTIKQGGVSCPVKYIQVSPIAVTVKISRMPYQVIDTQKLLEHFSVKLKNGSQVDIISNGSSTSAFGITLNFMFEEAVDPEEIESIALDGQSLEY